MARKKKGQNLQEKIDRYLIEYELDELNGANDMAALTQMCQIELNIEQIQNALDKIKDPLQESKKIKELQSASKDAHQSWVALQKELGINRARRTSEKDETPLKYIERLQGVAKTFLEKRLVKVYCEKCGQVLGKYLFYVYAKGEEGSIDSKREKVEQYKYTIHFECWKCGTISGVSNE